MTIDITDSLQRGGSVMVQLISYCVFTEMLDPLFLLLSKNYRIQPTSAKAIALFEEFIDSQPPLCVSLNRIERSSDWQLNHAVERIRESNRLVGMPMSEDIDNQRVHVPYLPARNLFDGIETTIASNSLQLPQIEASFDPDLSAIENLPDGTLNTTQRQFSEHVWKPSRQRLSAAGFYMIANIGG